MKVSGIIVAGGKSSRMGQDKTLLRFNNKSLIARTIAELQKVADEIIVASNHTSKYNIAGILEVPDTYQGMGPLGGMHAGLMAANYDYTFIVSADLPLFTGELAGCLLDRLKGYDAVVPRLDGRWEPLCAAYSRNCIKSIEACLQAEIKQVYRFYQQINVLEIYPSQLSCSGSAEKLFFNLNTPDDLKKLCIYQNNGIGIDNDE